METYQQSFCPENTTINTRWAGKNVVDWAASYNERHPDAKCPEGVLLSDSAEEVSLWLKKYVLPTRKTTGEKYPPRTIHLLLSGLQRYMSEQKEHSFQNFSQNTPFKQLMTTCDSSYRELCEEGVGATSEETEVPTEEEIERLWASGVLSPDTPQGLLNAVMVKTSFYVEELSTGH